MRRVSTGSLLAGAAYGALVAGARELRDEGTSRWRAACPEESCSRSAAYVPLVAGARELQRATGTSRLRHQPDVPRDAARARVRLTPR